MRPIILIPARMASIRLPDKPMAMVGEAPMIVQVLRIAARSGLGEVVVACDGDVIADAIIKEGGTAIITDPDLPSGSDRIYQALTQIDPDKNHDVVINLQGDMPTLDPGIIPKALALLENEAVDIATLAAPLNNEAEKNDPAVVKVTVQMAHNGTKGRARTFSRQASAKGECFHHIGIYAYRREALEKFVKLPPSPLELEHKLEQLRAMEAGMRIDVAIVDTVPLGVDTPETLKRAREWYEKKK